MELDEKQKLLKELEEVKAEIESALAVIKEGISDVDKAKQQGGLIQRLKWNEKEIIREIDQLAKEQKV